MWRRASASWIYLEGMGEMVGATLGNSKESCLSNDAGSCLAGDLWSLQAGRRNVLGIGPRWLLLQWAAGQLVSMPQALSRLLRQLLMHSY